MLGGQVLDRKDILDYGLKLTQGCRTTYAATESKIGPETFGFDVEWLPRSQEGFYEENGFYILDGSYALRPEAIESMYYAWRVTGDPKVSRLEHHIICDVHVLLTVFSFTSTAIGFGKPSSA